MVMNRRDYKKTKFGSYVVDKNNRVYIVIDKMSIKYGYIFYHKEDLLRVRDIDFCTNTITEQTINRLSAKLANITLSSVFINCKDKTYLAANSFDADKIIHKLNEANDELKNYIINIEKYFVNGKSTTWFILESKK